MAKKERIALKFVRKTSGNQEILFAVTGMPERTTAPEVTAHYILYSGNKNKRYKIKINSYITVKENGQSIITNIRPNFEEVTGKLLDEMYSKCCKSFRTAFPRQIVKIQRLLT